MKVGTDGVLLGAWTKVNLAANILDIGTGTGLIPLMMAQREPNAKIIGVEIDPSAATQAKENIANSKFKDQIEIVHSNIDVYHPENRFDLIVSNPPFFQNSTLSPTGERNLARHNESLTFKELLFHGARLLEKNGTLSIIVPIDAMAEVIAMAENHSLYIREKTIVYPNPKKESKRCLLAFSNSSSEAIVSKLILEKERHHYTSDAINLFKDFYLKL